MPSSETAEPLLEAKGIGRRAGENQWLLHNVSLTIRPHERWAITGPSGAGKTLFLRALALLDPLDEGTIRWRGRAIENDEVPNYRRDVIYLHQRPVLLEGTVESNLTQPYMFRGRKLSEFHRSWIVNLLEALGRDASFLRRSSRDLSGGESQIAALLRAVQLGPSVLLLDEPTAALDPQSVAAIETLVTRWLQEPGQARAVVWVSHDARQIGRVADQRLHLESGRESPYES